MNERCETFRYAKLAAKYGTGETILACRRYPPAVFSDFAEELRLGTARWPAVASADWCGEYQPTPPAAEASHGADNGGGRGST